MSESSKAWQYLKPKLQAHGLFERIESPITGGRPDVDGLYKRQHICLELKWSLNWPLAHPVLATQRNWHRRWIKNGGRSFFVIRVGNGIYCLPGHLAHIAALPDQGQLARHSVYLGVVRSGFDALEMLEACHAYQFPRDVYVGPANMPESGVPA